MKFGLRFWAWNFLARNTENYRSECPKKSASEISRQISRCRVSKSASRGCQKSACLEAKIRVKSGAWDEPLCLGRLGEMFYFGFLMHKCPHSISSPHVCCDKSQCHVVVRKGQALVLPRTLWQ